MFEPTGGKPNQRFACFYDFHGVKGVGWGGKGWGRVGWAKRSFALPHIHDGTLLYVFSHFLTYMMLRYCNSSCTSAHIMMLRYCNSSCTSAHIMMLRYCTSSCTSSHAWCYATLRLLALPHIHDATLLYVFLHFLTYMMLRYCNSSCTSAHIMMLRYCNSSCTSSHTWCYATLRLLALPHIHDATLLYVFLHFLTYQLVSKDCQSLEWDCPV